jgi:hypothetical protein
VKFNTIKKVIIFFVLIWLLSILWVRFFFDDWSSAANFGDSFGAINSLFSGFALILAVYSMLLQQKQNTEFQEQTRITTEQQNGILDVMRDNLIQQANAARVAALDHLIDTERQRIADLKNWGLHSEHKNENYYSKGIKAAERRADEYQEKIKELALKK